MDKGIVLSAIYPEIMTDCNALISRIESVAKKDLYQSVEFYFTGTGEEEAAVRETLAAYDLSCVYLAGFPMKQRRTDISSADEEIRKRSVKEVCELYEHAANLGASKLLFVSGPDWADREEERMIEQAVKSFAELDAFASEDGPELTLEYFPVVREPYLAIGSTGMVKKIYEGQKYRHIGITFDTSHVAQLGEDMIESFREVMPWTHHLHIANSMSKIKDHPLYGDRHPLFALENGDYALEEMRRNYLALLNSGMLEQVDVTSIEVISRGNKDWYFSRTSEEAAYIWR